jgi:hypothetical protein
VIGVDEHRWSHTRRTSDDGYVTVIIDLTPRPGAHGAGTAARPGGRLAADQSPQFRDQVQRTWAMQVSVRIQVVRYSCCCARSGAHFITQNVGSLTRR